MNFLNKDTLIEVASIGAGVVTGNLVANKVYGFLPTTITSKLTTPTSDYSGFVKGAIPVVGGLLLPTLAGNSRVVRGLANGMIATGGAKIVDSLLELVGVDSTKYNYKSIEGTDTMLNGIGEYGDSTMMSGGNTMLSGAMDGGAYDTYTAASYDTSYAEAGEMDY